MVSVNTIVDLAALPIGARVEAGQKRNGDQLVLGRAVLVLKGARRALGTRPPQVVVVAQLVVVAPLLDGVERRLGHLQRRVEAAGTRIP